MGGTKIGGSTVCGGPVYNFAQAQPEASWAREKTAANQTSTVRPSAAASTNVQRPGNRIIIC